MKVKNLDYTPENIGNFLTEYNKLNSDLTLLFIFMKKLN